MTWQEAGSAWGFRALDWAYLMEPLFTPVYKQLATAAHIGTGTRVLDVGCGAGGALVQYAALGADVAGVDASEQLLAIAADRMPTAELKHGTMTSLPWSDGSFDVVTGVNSFVYADDGALAEAHRLLTPGGLIAIGYWRDPGDFGACMQALGEALEPYAGPDAGHTPLRMSDPGVAGDLLGAAGFSVCEGGEVSGRSEFPNADIAYQAVASTGMLYPIAEAGEEDVLREKVTAQMSELAEPGLGVRMRGTFGWVTARKT